MIAIVQFGGVDINRCYSSGNCFTFNLSTPGWQPQPTCSFVDNYSPFLTWDAATVVIPDRRVAYFFGGRQTSSGGGCLLKFADLDDNWAIDLDSLAWERISGVSLYQGLPQLSGLSSH